MMNFPDPHRSSTSRVSHSTLLLFALIMVGNTLYMTNVSRSKEVLTIENVPGPCVREQPVAASNRFPDVVIFRKTKKTGSTSGLDAILRGLIPKGYFPLYNETPVVRDIVRAEGHKQFPRKLIVCNHNSISRKDTRNRFTVIADTVKDGYQQITSFCRYIRKVKECDSDEMRNCLRTPEALNQNRYRWTGSSKEDWETYIDLPLSAAHPALSTTVFRRVFPNITLDFPQNNVFGSTCEEIPSLRKIYEELYSSLEKQVLQLLMRMLTLTGYPSEMEGYSVEELLDAADRTERANYKLEKHKPTKTFGDTITNARVSSKSWGWYISKEGKLLMKDEPVFTIKGNKLKPV